MTRPATHSHASWPGHFRVRSGGLQAAAFHMAGAVMSHCPASGIAPCPDGVKNPSDASARGRTRSLSCSPSNLRGRQGGQPACRSHIASWSMTPHAHCSQQQAVAARPTTRSSSLFPPLHALLALGNVCDTLNKCDGVQGTVILGTKPLATNLSFIVSQALRFVPRRRFSLKFLPQNSDPRLCGDFVQQRPRQASPGRAPPS